MEKILVIGSGASGVHFALSVLRKGYRVIMLDVGQPRTELPNVDDSFNDLKAKLTDPAQFYLGQRYEVVVYPGSNREYLTKPYAFAPSKKYVFSRPQSFDIRTDGFEPLFSFAQGGLGEAWMAGVYPFTDCDLADFPFRYDQIESSYVEVAKRIGIGAARDDLTKFFPFHENLMEPLRLDENSQQLLIQYEKHKDYLRHKLNAYLGRSRIATLSSNKDGRTGCSYCGRCLWGCPGEALYTPSVTLKECLGYSNFTYVPNMYVSHLKFNSARQITSAVAESVIEKNLHEFTADRVVLAAGTLSSSKIFLDSIMRETGKTMKLTGLMDNRQILIPFLNLRMIGKTYNPSNYQYHQLAIGIETEKPAEYIHGQVTTLKSALVHPILHNVPFDLRTSIILFRNVRAGLGVVNLNLHDRRRDDNYITLEPDHETGHSRLVIHYSPPVGERAVINQAVKTMKKFLWKLGCVVAPGMTHVRPMGSSAHYAGTLPMSATNAPMTTSKYGQSHDFENLYFVDGTTFPSLPAKNLTFTLMANAVRVADNAF